MSERLSCSNSSKRSLKVTIWINAFVIASEVGWFSLKVFPLVGFRPEPYAQSLRRVKDQAGKSSSHLKSAGLDVAGR